MFLDITGDIVRDDIRILRREISVIRIMIWNGRKSCFKD